MFYFIFNELNLMLLITAIVFTAVGWFMDKRNSVEKVVVGTIDSLIDEGYLKTQGHGENMEILKWNECCRECSNNNET